jgi:hypothetical protein
MPLKEMVTAAKLNKRLPRVKACEVSQDIQKNQLFLIKNSSRGTTINYESLTGAKRFAAPALIKRKITLNRSFLPW